jgi:hypothetical protein
MALYPIQFALAFKQGDAQSPVVKGIPTQVNVMARWSDNSVKHAIFSILVDRALNQLETLEFEEGTPLGTVAGTPISFTAAIEMQSVGTVSLSELTATTWITGPIASTYIHADHSSSKDFMSASGTKVRPIFHVTHWHTLGNAEVRFIGENCNIAWFGESLAPIRCLINGVERYSILSRAWFDQMMSYGSRWTRKFWVNTAPAKPQIVKHDVAYLASSGATWNFDPAIAVTEGAVASMYTQWTNKVSAGDTEILKPGLWNKAMGSGGGSDFVGPWTTWIMLWLYTGDARMRTVCEGQADLGCQFPMQYRESDSAGSVYSVENHPACQLLNIAQNTARSGVTQRADLDSWGWNPDTSHQPDHYFPLYLLTGEFFHYEQAALWASWSCAFYNHQGTTAEFGCGPTGTEGGIPGLNAVTIRGQAWVFRSRCEVGAFAPDSRTEKAYFNRMIEDCIAIWEGERNIVTTSYFNTPNWNWGRTTTPSEHPLRYWQHGNSAFILNANNTPNGDVDPSKASTGLSTWEQNFLVLALMRGLELGYPTDALVNWITPNIQGQQDNLTWNIASNRSPTRNPSGSFFTTWAQVLACFDVAWAAGEGIDYQALFLAKVGDLNHGYTNIARAAAKAVNAESAWMAANAVPNFTTNPKWAILTRTSQPPPPPPPPTPTPGITGSKIKSGVKFGSGMKIGKA